jgi:hypothetical protein
LVGSLGTSAQVPVGFGKETRARGQQTAQERMIAQRGCHHALREQDALLALESQSFFRAIFHLGVSGRLVPVWGS